MDSESIKQLTNDINRVVDAHTKPLHVAIKNITAQLEWAWRELNGIKNKNKRLREALRIYGHHSRTDDTTMCEHMKDSDYPCTCGFEQALAETEKI